MRRTMRTAIAFTGAMAVMVLIAGCVTTEGEYDGGSTGEEKLAGSLSELFEQALDDETNPFVIDVLDRAIETGKIAQEDYDEAHRLYRVCMSDAGYEESYEQLANGSYKIAPPALDGQEAVEEYMSVGSDCSDELAPVESLFILQQGNPDLLADPEQVVVQCLNEAGLVGADYTAEDFREDRDARFQQAPYDPMSAEAQECFSNAGFSISVGE